MTVQSTLGVMSGLTTVTGLTPDSAGDETGYSSDINTGETTELSIQGDIIPDQTKSQPLQLQPNKTWSDIVSEAEHFVSDQPVLSHKPEVTPVFLNFKWVAREGFKIPLIEVAAVVGKVVGDAHIDGIQPMRSGWQIYVKTDKDQDALVAQGIQLAGKWISLQAPTRTPGFSINAKIILKDLPLNEVSNEQVLKAVKERCEVKSEVWYSNIWIDGKKTYLCNRDRFFYVSDEDVAHFEKAFHMGGFKARVVKPVMYN